MPQLLATTHDQSDKFASPRLLWICSCLCIISGSSIAAQARINFVTPQNLAVYYIPEGKDTISISVTLAYEPDSCAEYTHVAVQWRLRGTEWIRATVAHGNNFPSRLYLFPLRVAQGEHTLEAKLWQLRTEKGGRDQWQLIAYATPTHFYVLKTFGVTVRANFPAVRLCVDGALHADLPVTGIRVGWAERSKHHLCVVDSQEVGGYTYAFDYWAKDSIPFAINPIIAPIQTSKKSSVYEAKFHKLLRVTLSEPEANLDGDSITYRVNGVTVPKSWSGWYRAGWQSYLVVEALCSSPTYSLSGWVDDSGIVGEGNPLIFVPTDNVNGLRPTLVSNSQESKFSKLRQKSEAEKVGSPRCGLGQNYPNPPNPVTTIPYYVKAQGQVTLTVHDILGRRIGLLVNEFKASGDYTVLFDASSLPSGVYVYRLIAGQTSDVKRMILAK